MSNQNGLDCQDILNPIKILADYFTVC